MLLLEKQLENTAVQKEKNNNPMQSYCPAIPTGVNNLPYRSFQAFF